MSNLTTALLIVLSINAMFILGQFAVNNVTDGDATFYNCSGTIHAELGTCSGGTYALNSADSIALLPSGESTSVNEETGNIFTDAFTGLKNWLLTVSGLKYVVQILSTPYVILLAIGLPPAFAFAVGGLWYGMTLFLLLSWLFGRDN